MGASIDWSRERFTMDAGLSHAVQEVFIRLYEEGLIYRGKRLVNWDPLFKPRCQILKSFQKKNKGVYGISVIHFEDITDYIVVATTRPETLFGDMAVAVHPDDERYQHLIGKKLKLPLTDRLIPIIADDHVDPAFGTGCVKITPAS